MKAYTDLEQSKKLAEILPFESADMCWQKIYDENHLLSDYRIELLPFRLYSGLGVPAWSLAALLGVLNKTAYFMNEDASVDLSSYKTTEWDLGIDNSDLELITESNPVDACYEMILKLKEQNLL